MTDSSSKPIIRTVYAGDGFLSQWNILAFRIRSNGKLNKVLVVWPDGKRSEVKEIKKSGF